MNKINSNNNSPRKRGRQAGSVSFLQVSLKELNRVLKEDAQVILSLKYGMLVGLQGKPVGGDMTVFEYAVNSGKADVVLESFDDNKEESEPPKDLTKAKGKEEESLDDDYVQPIQADLTFWDDEGEDNNNPF